MPIFEDVKNAGFVGFLLLLFGIVGLALAVVAVVLAASKQRSSFIVGLTALGVAAVILFGGALGTVYGRHLTDRALEAVGSQVTVERIKRVGYEESRSASKLGLIFGLAPLLMGAFAAFSGAGRRKEDAPGSPYGGPKPMAEPEGNGFVVSTIFVGIDLMGIAGAALLFLAPLPGRAWAVDDPTWKVLEHCESVLHPEPLGEGVKDPSTYCDPLALSLAEPGVRREDVPELQEAASTCVAHALREALDEPANVDKRLALEKLEQSALVMTEEDHKKVHDAAEKIPKAEPPAEASGFGEAGNAGASGRLPPEVIQRIVRQSMGAIKGCYERGLAKNPRLEGTVKARFIIGKEGEVTLAQGQGSTLPDPDVESCVLKVVFRMKFPAPEGGIVSVVYPFAFKPAE